MHAGLPKYVPVNLKDIEAAGFQEGEEVSLETLKEKGLINPSGRERKLPLKVLLISIFEWQCQASYLTFHICYSNFIFDIIISFLISASVTQETENLKSLCNNSIRIMFLMPGLYRPLSPSILSDVIHILSAYLIRNMEVSE